MRATEVKKGVTVKYNIPEEGAQMWVDMMAMPKDAPSMPIQRVRSSGGVTSVM
jgi:spermidine/putrescine-binding protein